jgi:hypothetical protein
MKVIEIKKHFTNGCVLAYLILDSDYYDEDIEYEVESWCNKNAAGQSSGWRSEWKEVTDPIDRGVTIMEEIRKIERSLERMEKRKQDLIDHLIVPFVEIYKK